MKRSVLFFALFALIVVALDLGRADAQDPFSEVSETDELDHRHQSADWQQGLRANIKILRDTSKTPDERAKAHDAVRQILTEMFDADVERRRKQLENLRSQVSELTTQLDAREKSRDEMVKLRLLLFDQEVSGDKAFPKEWGLLSESTGATTDGPAARPPVIASLPSITNSIGMKLVHIPKGELTVKNGKVGVTDANYFLGQTEVTQGQWKAVMETEPWKGQEHVKEGDDYPATFVSYDDAVKFCEELSDKEGKEYRQYRLPTEGEWEYACRAGSKAAFSFGDSGAELGEYAWFVGNTHDEQFAHQVATKRPNAWSLYDMHGNVVECTSTKGSGAFRVDRGGSWSDTPANCRSASRFRNGPSGRSNSLGFRVASVPSGPPVEKKSPQGAAPGGGGTEVVPEEPPLIFPEE